MRGRYESRRWEWNPGIHAPTRCRKNCTYDAFVPDPIAHTEPVIPGALAGTISEAEDAIAGLNRAARPELLPLARLLLRTESIASSRVEGLQLETRALARAEAKQDAGRTVGAAAAEILANIDAMQLAIEETANASHLDEEGLLAVHRALLARARPGIAGRFRTVQNWVGGNDYNPCGSDFVPPPPEELPRLLADLCSFCNDETLPPVVQAAVAHARFETLHPFEDGNGRVGRALVQLVLRRRGLTPTFVPPISVVLAHDKDQYINGLTLFREDRVAEWLEIFSTATATAAMLAERYVASIERVLHLWGERLRAQSRPRTDSAVWDVLRILPAHHIITVPIGIAATQRSKPAVTHALAELEAAEVLTRLGESQRYRA